MYDTITKNIGDRNIKEDYSWLVDMNKTRCKFGKKWIFKCYIPFLAHCGHRSELEFFSTFFF